MQLKHHEINSKLHLFAYRVQRKM